MKQSVLVRVCSCLLIMGSVAGCQRTPTDPRPAALAYYTALSRQDWKAMYPLTAFSREEKEVYKSADEFAVKMEKQLAVDVPNKQGFDLLKGLTAITVSPATINGNRAEVPTSATLNIADKTLRFHGVAHMIEEGNAWKFDTSASGIDVTAKAIAQLLGKSEKALP